MKWSFLPGARDEVRETFRRYELERDGLGSEFAHALAAAIRDVLENPQAWARASRRCRRRNLKRFPYKVIYRVVGESIEVVAVAHHKRRSGYWHDRLGDAE